jgi:hypothetical protein
LVVVEWWGNELAVNCMNFKMIPRFQDRFGDTVCGILMNVL